MKKIALIALIVILKIEGMEAPRPCSAAENKEKKICAPSQQKLYNRNVMNRYCKEHAEAQEEATLEYVKTIDTRPGQSILNVQSGKSITTWLTQKIQSTDTGGFVMNLTPIDIETTDRLPENTFDHIICFAAFWGVLSENILHAMHNALKSTGNLHIAINGYDGTHSLKPDADKDSQQRIININRETLRNYLNASNFTITHEAMSHEKCTFKDINAFKNYIRDWEKGECSEPTDWYIEELCNITAKSRNDQRSYYAPRLLIRAQKKP